MLATLMVLEITASISQTNKDRYEVFPVCFNTSGDEYAPRIVNGNVWFLSDSKAADGSLLMDEIAKKPFTDVFVKDSCNRIDANLRSAEGGEWLSISSQYYDGPVASALGGKVLFFTNNSDPELNGKMGLFGLQQVTDTTWTYLEGITFNSDQYSIVHPYFDESTSTLYFSSDMDTTGKDFDIYRIRFAGTFEGSPTQVIEVNSPSNEWFPMLSNGQLNFTSDREGGFGGMDVYYLEMGKVMHYPAPINSPQDDYDVHYLGGPTAFVSSNRLSAGVNDDIFTFIDYGVTPNVIASKSALERSMDSKLSALNGVISDATLSLDQTILGSMAVQSFTAAVNEAKALDVQEQQLQKALIAQSEQLKRDVAKQLMSADNIDYVQAAKTQAEIDRLADRLMTSSNDPVASRQIMDSIRQMLQASGMDNSAIAKMEQQISGSIAQIQQLEERREIVSRQMDNVAALVISEVKQSHPDKLASLGSFTQTFPNAEKESMDLVKLFGEEAVKEYAKSFVSSPILFAFDSDDLREEYSKQLNDFASFVNKFPMFNLFVDGHTDIIGNRSYNMKLASRRAKSVQRYLIKQGVTKTVFVLESYGPNRPIQSNDTREGRKANRRVEIRLVPAVK